MSKLSVAERFLLVTYDCMLEHPRDLVSPQEVGLRLGLAYDRVVEVVEALDCARLVRRVGSERILSDARLMITDGGYEAIRELQETASHDA